MHKHKILKISPQNKELQNSLSKSLGVSKILSQLLINRGISSASAAKKFLKAQLSDLLDPFSFPDMYKAVSLITESAKKNEKIMIFGDYDVDGVTSAALLKNTLAKKGIKALHHLPHRVREGYGLNKETLQMLKGKDVKLLITADCGTSNFDEITELNKHNIKVIVTDHHQPQGEHVPSAAAIINPKLKNCAYKDKDLAGVGVAYKLCQALTGEDLREDLDLVSLGTIADVVPLVGENRIIAKAGLKKITEAKRTGIKALIEVSRIGRKEINSTFVSFILGPRINASGRMDTAETSFRLLTCNDKEEADQLAKTIDTYNRQRQKIESGIMEEAQAIIDSGQINIKDHKVIVVAKEGWHQGVLGIVASKLMDRFYRPTIAISMTDRLCKGSGRSIKNFHLFSALMECQELLENYGGHSHAVGLVVTRDNLEEFKDKINLLARKRLLLEDLLPSLEVDMALNLSDLSYSLVHELKRMEPFGSANPRPLFYTPGLKLKSEPAVLSRDTLKFWVTDGVLTYPVIGFGMGSFKSSLISASLIDLVYTPQIDNWRDDQAIILEAKEMIFK